MKVKLILEKEKFLRDSYYNLFSLKGKSFLLDLCPRLVHKFLGIRLKPGEKCKIELEVKARKIK